jgi:hypothetical protein
VVQFGRLGLIELHTTTFLDFGKPLRAVLFSLVFFSLERGILFAPVLSDRVCLYRIKLSCQRLINQKKIRGFKLTSSKQCLVVETTKQQRDKDLFLISLQLLALTFLHAFSCLKLQPENSQQETLECNQDLFVSPIFNHMELLGYE